MRIWAPVERMRRIDPAEPPVGAMRRIIASLLPDIYAEDRDRILARSRLIYGTPELASAVNGQLTDFERLLAGTLAEVHGRAPDNLEARVVAAVSVAAMRCAIEQWVVADGTPDELKAKVGKERIELIFGSDADLKKARKLITTSSVKADKDRRSISVAHGGGVTGLRQLLETLEKSKLHVESLSLHKPTLDDVFLKLTGHQAGADDEKTAEKGKEK
mgnify:CR=1 FL=1